MTDDELEKELEDIQTTCEYCGDDIDANGSHYHETYKFEDEGLQSIGHICSIDCLADFPTAPLAEDYK